MLQLRKLFFWLLLLAVLPVQLRANEGMWLPSRVAEYIDQMQKLGLKLSAEEIYSLNQPSLKDAIVHFGGFCTGEIVSKKGLVFTNHHCGYDAIASLSTPQANYLDDGYWSPEFSKDLPAKGLMVRILRKIEDVTERVELADDKQQVIKQIIQEAKGAGQYHAVVTPIFYGNQYLLWVYDEFKDIRFVGTPPAAIGKFGGDTDNWMWPRHTGDFAVFRIYASPDNEPAEYSPENIPYTPRHALPVSIAGVKAGDFSMILGFPGRTTRYLPPALADFKVNVDYPRRAKVYARRIQLMKEEMAKDVQVRLNLASMEARLANGEKYFRGVVEMFADPKVSGHLTNQAAALTKWAQENKETYPEYANLAEQFNQLYEEYNSALMQDLYMGLTFSSTFPLAIGGAVNSLYDALKSGAEADKIEEIRKSLTGRLLPAFAKFHAPTNQKVMAELIRIGLENLPANQAPAYFSGKNFQKVKPAKGGDRVDAFVADIFKRSVLADSTRMARFLQKPSVKALEKDPGFQLYLDYASLRLDLSKTMAYMQKKESEMLKTWMAALMKSQPNRVFYPDANSTLRLSFGTAIGYDGPDGKRFEPFTSHEGILEKEIPNDEEFHVPAGLKTLLVNRDFGRYAQRSGLAINFLTDHDITGGNSGSPVINGKGELVGIAFDGNWEGMAGDIVFDSRVKRTISVDIRYVLFVMDKLGGAKNLIEELEIRN